MHLLVLFTSNLLRCMVIWCIVVIPIKLEFGASVGFIHKESVTMHGHTIVNYLSTLRVKIFFCEGRGGGAKATILQQCSMKTVTSFSRHTLQHYSYIL